VVKADEPLAAIDTRTFAVGAPGALPAVVEERPEQANGTAWWPWIAAAGALLVLATTRRLLRSGTIPTTTDPARTNDNRRPL
jgi:hypothetical protein